MSVPMPMRSDPDAIRPVTLQGQIIVGALVAGLMTFLVIVTVIDLGSKPGGGAGAAGGGGGGARGVVPTDQPLPIITYLAVACAAVLLPTSFIVPVAVSQQQRRAIAAGKMNAGDGSTPPAGDRLEAAKTPKGGLPAAFLTQLIVGAAMIEGAAFFTLAVYLIEKNPIALGAAIVLIAALVVRIPTAGRVERWIEQQQEKLREDQLDTLSSY